MARDFPNKGKKKAEKTPVEGWRSLIDIHSPYLALNLENLPSLPLGDPDHGFADILRATAPLLDKSGDTEELMRHLRLAKRKVATLIAVADLSKRWNDITVMQKLSEFADFCVKHALKHLLLKNHAAKKIKLPDPKSPEKNSGVSVIALGKWGAHELNYSSDIDLMVLFDPQRSSVRDSDETQNFFIRLTRDLARIIDQPTEDGYVFRTDLRLRPDPGAMPLAVSLGTAEIYYGSLGQNWERAAMIKARPVAGDEALGRDFNTIMNAWIWRKNLDFAAIQDIHSIKRQINARQKPPVSKENPFLGYNVKLGHGGIREIEFFAQTQQLIFGGRQPELRTPATLSALTALEKNEHIDATAKKSLSEAYLFLRHVEHRLQMIDDRQTHSLPDTPVSFKNFAAFMEYSSAEKLKADLQKHTDTVKKLYAGLFADQQNLAGPGNLVFTGVEDDPETLVTLKDIGFGEPQKVTAAVRGWHHGRYRAMRSEKARQMLTELVPHLLQALSKTPHPDDALIRFDAFLGKLPSGVPIFSMFTRNPQQMELVADIMGTSPVLAEYLGTHPQVLDGVLTRDFFGSLPTCDSLKKDLSALLATAQDYQDVLDLARRWAKEKRFHAGIHILQNLSLAEVSAQYLADIADAAVCCLVPYVEEEFAKQHGRFKGGELAIIGMGSFAARHMFFDSDLDVIGIYKTGAKDKLSDGDKPLQANVYYIRLMQRVITALSAPTSEGVLYNTDTRLRPSGEDGPLAVSFDAFFDYQQKDAWVWEHMSLIRSRPVYAKTETAKKFETEKTTILRRQQPHTERRAEMLDMRAKVEREFGSKDIWNVKYARGGIMDIMFATHFLMLEKSVFHPDLKTGLELLIAKNLLSKKDFDILTKTLHLAEAVQGFLRLAAETPFAPAKASAGLKAALLHHVSPEKKMTFASLEQRLKKDFAQSYAVFKKVMS